jgi:hypothetical protein
VRSREAVLVAVALSVGLFVPRLVSHARPLPRARAAAAQKVLVASARTRAKAPEPARAAVPEAPRLVARAPAAAVAPRGPPEEGVADGAPALGSCAREIDKCAEGSDGSATTCFNLGRMYETGMCGAKAPRAATDAFLRGCDLGNRSACHAAGHVEEEPHAGALRSSPR